MPRPTGGLPAWSIGCDLVGFYSKRQPAHRLRFASASLFQLTCPIKSGLVQRAAAPGIALVSQSMGSIPASMDYVVIFR